MNDNLFSALRGGFPADLDSIAIETGDGAPLYYTWRDLDRGTAMLANLLDSLALPKGARIAVQVEKSVEAMLLYLATLRAGYRVSSPQHVPTRAPRSNTSSAMPSPAVVGVHAAATASWVGRHRESRPAHQHVFTLDDDRTGTPARNCRRSAQRPAQGRAAQAPTSMAAILYTSGTTGRSKGAMLTPPQPAVSNAAGAERRIGAGDRRNTAATC